MRANIQSAAQWLAGAAVRAGVGVALCTALLPAAARAEYPDHPIKLVIPYTPGGPADVLGRIVAQKMGVALGQSVVVENKPGASLAIGAEYVAKSRPDGYTLFLGAASMLVESASGRKPQDNLRDFAPISTIGTFPLVVMVNQDLPIRTVQDLIAYARAHPGKTDYGSSGIGSLTHLAGALFVHMANVDMMHVPYRGVNEALNDLVAGRVQVVFPGAPVGLPLARAGRARAIAVTGSERSATDPSLPTVAEGGLKGYAVNPWYGILAPVGTPQAIIDRWHGEMVKIMQSEDVRQRWLTLGADAVYSKTPAEFEALMRSEAAKWAELVRAAHIDLQ
jgi:tripartite-type tricarboxylate transporter receptor subunit TctC